MATEFPEIMTISETCQFLRIPRSSLYKLAQEGRIPCQKVGRHWRFRRQALEHWLEEKYVDNPEEDLFVEKHVTI